MRKFKKSICLNWEARWRSLSYTHGRFLNHNNYFIWIYLLEEWITNLFDMEFETTIFLRKLTFSPLYSLFRSVGSSKNAIQLANTPLDAQYFQGIQFNLFGSNSWHGTYRELKSPIQHRSIILKIDIFLKCIWINANRFSITSIKHLRQIARRFQFNLKY